MDTQPEVTLDGSLCESEEEFPQDEVALESHDEFLTHGIQGLRRNELLFDYTLIAEGKCFPVHKVVMAVTSDYFQAMVCADMQESKEGQAELKGLTAEGLQAVVDFAYTGYCDLSIETAEQIVSAASYFQIPKLLYMCRGFLTENVIEAYNYRYYVDVFNMNRRYCLNVDDIERHAVENFEFIPAECLLNLSGDDLLEILKTGRYLRHASEYELFMKVLSWINDSPDISEDLAFELLNTIRYPLMNTDELSEVAQTEVMTSAPRFQNLLSEAVGYHKDVLKQPLLQSGKTALREPRPFVVVGVDKLHRISIMGKNIESTECPMNRKFSIYEAVMVEDFLYVSGSYDDTGSGEPGCFYRFDPRFDTWLKLPPMKTIRFGACRLIPFENSIYAFGAYDEATECYSIRENRWDPRIQMDIPRVWMAGAKFADKIYLCGGYLDPDVPENDVDCYYPATDIWESKASMTTPRMKHSIAKVNDRLIVFGGLFLRSFEYYSPDLDVWTAVNMDLSFYVSGMFVNTDLSQYITRELMEVMRMEILDKDKNVVLLGSDSPFDVLGIENNYEGGKRTYKLYTIELKENVDARSLVFYEQTLDLNILHVIGCNCLATRENRRIPWPYDR